MNKIVREHYPVEKLPEDLRRDLDPSRPVTLVIEQQEGDPTPDSITAILEEMQDRRVLSGDPVERVRALRAEWGRRDEHLEHVRNGDAS